MDARDHQDIVVARESSEERYDLVAGGRVKTARRFVEVEDLGAGDQLCCHTDPALLPSTKALLQRRADECLTLVPQTEGLDELVHAMLQFTSLDSARERKPG